MKYLQPLWILEEDILRNQRVKTFKSTKLKFLYGIFLLFYKGKEIFVFY